MTLKPISVDGWLVLSLEPIAGGLGSDVRIWFVQILDCNLRVRSCIVLPVLMKVIYASPKFVSIGAVVTNLAG